MREGQVCESLFSHEQQRRQKEENSVQRFAASAIFLAQGRGPGAYPQKTGQNTDSQNPAIRHAGKVSF